MSDIAVRVEGLGKQYRLGDYSDGRQPEYGSLRESLVRGVRRVARSARWGRPGIREGSQPREVWALRDVSFEVLHGEVLGIIGRNGAGKSTLLKVLSRITEPTSGRAEVHGRVGSILEVGTGFHPELTGRENIYLNGAILGMSRAQIRRGFDEIVAFAELEEFLDTPVKRYSTGMYMRLAFSVAAHLDPDVLIVDEVLAVGDAEFQKKCLGKMSDVAGQGRTVFFVSHNMGAVQRLCHRAILLDHGRVVENGPPGQVVTAYLHQHGLQKPRVEWPELARRPGDEFARLCSVEVSQPGRELHGRFSSSVPIEVRIEVDILQSHSAFTAGFELLTSDGEVIFWSFFTDGPEEKCPLPEGRTLLTCEIPAGLLNEGEYQVRPLLMLYFIKWIVQGEAVLQFPVQLDHPRSAMWYQRRPGAVAPFIPWQVTPSAAPGSAPARPAMSGRHQG